MTSSSSDLSPFQQQLSSLASQLRTKDSQEAWDNVQTAARSLADGLRVRDGPIDNHTFLGKTDLPQTIADLVKLATPNSSTPSPTRSAPTLELLRVGANLCPEHDENRSHLLEAGVPQTVVSLLEGYAEPVSASIPTDPLPLDTQQLKVIKTSVGVLLNASLGYEPVKDRLNSLETAKTVLKLSMSIYPSGSWMKSSISSAEEEWELRSGISDWSWRLLSELRDVKDESNTIFGSEVLPFLATALRPYIPPYHTTPTELDTDLVLSDYECLEESCTLLESLSLDVEEVRLSLARGFRDDSEHTGVACLSIILDFIEFAEYSPTWKSLQESEQRKMEKAFDIFKAALIKCAVEVAGEEGAQDVLWWDESDEQPGGKFICKMVGWIKSYVEDADKESGPYYQRDDLVICASLSLGNLVRKEKHAQILMSKPHALNAVLTSKHLLSPEADIKMKHGVLGLLKHLVQSSLQAPELQASLTKSHVVSVVSQSGVWDEKADAMAEVVQTSAIGIVKHLCSSDVENTFDLVLPPSSAANTSVTGLSRILALTKRSDSISIKSEGTRVLVSVVRSIWSLGTVSSPIGGGPSPIADGTITSDSLAETQKKKYASLRAVLTPECATALASLVARSGKYPILVNEGIVALSLLSTQRIGGPLVLKAIQEPAQPFKAPGTAPIEPPSASASTNSDVSSPTVSTPRHGARLPTPHTALDMMIGVLKNVDNPVNFAAEVRMNACSLLIQLVKNNGAAEFATVKETLKPILDKLYDTLGDAQGREELLRAQVVKVREALA